MSDHQIQGAKITFLLKLATFFIVFISLVVYVYKQNGDSLL